MEKGLEGMKMVEDENVGNGLGGEGDDKRGGEGVVGIVSVYHMTRLSLIFSTGLGMTLQISTLHKSTTERYKLIISCLIYGCIFGNLTLGD